MTYGSLKIQVDLEADCLPPGGRQGITIVTDPKIGVAYHALYADGTNAYSDQYYGGNNGGETDEHGIWRDTWIVNVDAPPGRVQVDVVAQGPKDSGYVQAWFAVSDPTGSCS